MGLIIGPIFLFWLAMTIYSSVIGYKLLNSAYNLMNGSIFVLVALFFATVFLIYGFSTFKSHKTLGSFDIVFYFILNKFTFILFVIALVLHWFGGNVLDSFMLKTIPFIVMFSISLSAVTGVILSELFMDKYNIKRTY